MYPHDEKAKYHQHLDQLAALVDPSSELPLSENVKRELAQVISDILCDYDSLTLASYLGKNSFVIDEARCCDYADVVRDIKRLLTMSRPKS